MTERERLIKWMNAAGWDHVTLGRAMKWSPTYIYGFLGGAWSLTQSFRLAFAQTFGDEAADQIFVTQQQPATLNL